MTDSTAMPNALFSMAYRRTEIVHAKASESTPLFEATVFCVEKAEHGGCAMTNVSERSRLGQSFRLATKFRCGKFAC